MTVSKWLLLMGDFASGTDRFCIRALRLFALSALDFASGCANAAAWLPFRTLRRNAATTPGAPIPERHPDRLPQRW